MISEFIDNSWIIACIVGFMCGFFGGLKHVLLFTIVWTTLCFSALYFGY